MLQTRRLVLNRPSSVLQQWGRRTVFTPLAAIQKKPREPRPKKLRYETIEQLSQLPRSFNSDIIRKTDRRSRGKPMSKTMKRSCISAKYLLKKSGGFANLEGTNEELTTNQLRVWLKSIIPVRRNYGYPQLQVELKKQIVTLNDEDLSPQDLSGIIKSLGALGLSGKVPELKDWLVDKISKAHSVMTLNDVGNVMMFMSERLPDHELFLKVKKTMSDELYRASKYSISQYCVASASMDVFDEESREQVADQLLSLQPNQMFMFETYQLIDILWSFVKVGAVHDDLFDMIAFELSLESRKNPLNIYVKVLRILTSAGIYHGIFFRTTMNKIATEPQNCQPGNIFQVFMMFMEMSPGLSQSGIDQLDFALIVRRMRVILAMSEYRRKDCILECLRLCHKQSFYDLQLIKMLIGNLRSDELSKEELKTVMTTAVYCGGIDMAQALRHEADMRYLGGDYLKQGDFQAASDHMSRVLINHSGIDEKDIDLIEGATEAYLEEYQDTKRHIDDDDDDDDNIILDEKAEIVDEDAENVEPEISNKEDKNKDDEDDDEAWD